MWVKIISYLYPITKKIESEFSGKLELTTINGKRLLDTEHTNYSYGSLQRVLKFSLKQLDLSNTKSILLLGLGGGSVIKTIREDFKFELSITAIEIDPVVIEIAKKEFNVQDDKTTKIIKDDAFNFVKKNTTKFDLIIVDIFIDNIIPDQFLSLEFWANVLDNLEPNGTIIFNTLCFPSTNLIHIKEKFRRRGIDFQVHRFVEKSNKVIIAKKNKIEST